MEQAIISEAIFKENSPIKDSTVIDKFVPYVIIAQKMYIERIIGRELLKQLQEQVKAASVTPAPTPNPITPANQALLLEIAPVLSFYAVYQGLPFHWASIVNKGVTIGESENSSGVGLNDLAQLRRWLKDDAEAWATRLVGYLCGCNSNTYPLWTPGDGYGCGSCGPSTRKVPLDAGIYLPKRRRRHP